MRNIRNKYKFITGAFLTFVLGVGGGAMTMAAIPSSSTSLITACRDDATGSLRVVDTDSNESCATGESQIAWSGEQSAVMRVIYDQDNLNDLMGKVDAQHSRGILGTKKVIEGAENAWTTGYCVHLAFQPLYVNSGSSMYNAYQGGGDINGVCGSGYEVFINCSGDCVSSSPYYFTN